MMGRTAADAKLKGCSIEGNSCLDIGNINVQDQAGHSVKLRDFPMTTMASFGAADIAAVRWAHRETCNHSILRKPVPVYERTDARRRVALEIKSSTSYI